MYILYNIYIYIIYLSIYLSICVSISHLPPLQGTCVAHTSTACSVAASPSPGSTGCPSGSVSAVAAASAKDSEASCRCTTPGPSLVVNGGSIWWLVEMPFSQKCAKIVNSWARYAP